MCGMLIDTGKCCFAGFCDDLSQPCRKKMKDSLIVTL